MERVLFVDDDPLMLRAMRRGFADAYEVTTSPGGADALAHLRTASDAGAPFAVVVSDLAMPYMDGAAFFHAAELASPRAVQVLITGTFDGPSKLTDADRTRIFAIVAKPCTNAAMRKTIELALDEFKRRAG